jgi:hypothetical protein
MSGFDGRLRIAVKRTDVDQAGALRTSVHLVCVDY